MRVCILMAGSNVHGRILAAALKRFSPLVINETGTERAEKLSNWLAPDYGPPMPESIPVPHFHGPEARALLDGCDYAVNGGCGIIKSDFLSIPRHGWLNAHPGLLPEYRGAEPVCWAVHNLDSIGATVHLLDEGLDTGPILIRREMPWREAISIKQLRLQAIEFGAELLAEYLSDPDHYPPIPQDREEGFTYSVYCSDDPKIAERRLGPHLSHYANGGACS